MSPSEIIRKPESLQGDYTCFTVGDEEYGILTQDVTGVQEAPIVRRVPKAPVFIKGVANIRGRILTVIDTCSRFETVQSNSDTGKMIVAQVDGISFGLLADQVIGISRLEKEMIEPVNPVLVDRQMPFITAMALVNERLLHLIEMTSLVYAGVEVSKKEKTAYAGHAQKALTTYRQTKQTDYLRHLVMKIGHETYGLDMGALKEVKTKTKLEKLSSGPKYLEGMIKTADGMIPVIDLQKKYDLEPDPFGPQSRIVLMDTTSGLFGILANTASEMINIPTEEIKETPKAITGEQTKHIKNIALLGQKKRLVAILEPAHILTEDDYKTLSKVEGVDMRRQQKKRKTTGGKAVKAFLTFELSGHEFAFDMANLVEVIPYQPVSRIPKAPAHIRGLIHVKGELVPVTDLTTLLEIDNSAGSDEKHIIIVQKSDGLHGIIAERVREILHVEEKNLIEPGDFSKGIKLDAIEKAIRIHHSDRVPMVLNLDKTISWTESYRS